MAQATQLGFAFDDAGEWITAEDAASLVNDSPRTWQRKGQWEVKQSRLQSRPSLARKVPPASGGPPIWHVHRSIDQRLTKYPTRDQREDRQREALITRYTEPKVEAAYRKARWLRAWRTLCESEASLTEAESARRIAEEAREVEGPEFGITLRTLQRWRKAYNALGPDGQIRGVEVLIDQRGERVGGWGPHHGRSQEAIDCFYSLYRSGQRLTIKACHRSTLRKAGANGWKWAPKYSSTQKWLGKTDDLAETCARRYGRTGYSKKFMPHIEIDYTVLEPADQYVIDHT